MIFQVFLAVYGVNDFKLLKKGKKLKQRTEVYKILNDRCKIFNGRSKINHKVKGHDNTFLLKVVLKSLRGIFIINHCSPFPKWCEFLKIDVL